jgi:hypothetical protein
VEATFDFSDGHELYKSLISFDHDKALMVDLAGNDLRNIKLKNVIAFPGLINSHDHLDFNLFPFLGNKIYDDYTQWGGDIHKNNNQQINTVLGIPLSLRIRWGIFKNLISGVTNIVHHGGHHDLIRKFPYPVFLNYQYLHSLETERFWKIKVNLPVRGNIMIHIGEGTNQKARREIDQLISYNLFNRGIVGVHAIEMDEGQSNQFKAIVWCPDSNIKLYGKTASVNRLKLHTAVLFGTDSTVSASPNIWEQLRNARELDLLSDGEIFESLVEQPLKIFHGMIPNGYIIARKKSSDIWNSFFKIDPEDLLLVTIKNKVMLIDQSIVNDTPFDYTPIQIGQSMKLVQTFFGSIVRELEELGVPLPLNIKSV